MTHPNDDKSEIRKTLQEGIRKLQQQLAEQGQKTKSTADYPWQQA